MELRLFSLNYCSTITSGKKRSRRLALCSRWIAFLGNPDYHDILGVDAQFEKMRKFADESLIEQKKAKQRSATRNRVTRYRSRKKSRRESVTPFLGPAAAKLVGLTVMRDQVQTLRVVTADRKMHE